MWPSGRSRAALSRELDLHVIALAQMSRSVEFRADRRPTIADLERGLEDDSDLVLLLHREDAYRPAPRRDAGILEVIVAYNRDGEPRTFQLAFTKRTLTIADLPPAAGDAAA